MPDNIFSDTFDSQLPEQIQTVIDLLCKADAAILSLIGDARNIDLSCRGLDTYEKLIPLLAQVNTAYGNIRDTLGTVTGAATLLNAVTAQYGEAVKNEIVQVQQLQSQMQLLSKSLADMQEQQKALAGNKTAWQQLADAIGKSQSALADTATTATTHVKSLNALLAQARKDALKGDEDLAKSRYELQKQSLEQTKAQAKTIYDNEQATLQQRLDAYRQYEAARTQLAEAEKEKAIVIAEDKMKQIYAKGVTLQAAGKMTPELNAGLGNEYDAALMSREAAYEQYNAQLKHIAESAAKDILTITRSAGAQWLQDQKATLQAHLENDEQAAYAELLHLQDRLAKGEISLDDYGKKVTQMNRAYQQQILQDTIAGDNEALKNDQLSQQQRLEILKDRMNKENELMKMQGGHVNSSDNDPKNWLQSAGGAIYNETHSAPDAAGYTDFAEHEAAYRAYTKKKEQFETEFAQYATQLAQQTADAVITIQDNEYEHEAQLLDKQERTLELQNEQKIAAINASTGYAITKQNELTQTNAQAAARENQIEAQKKELSIRKAKFDKAASIASIIENTATAIIKAWVEAGGDPAIAIPLTALIAGIGAAQLAKAASTPIPQYARGTTNHTGGYAIVGEAGEREWIQTPAGAGFWSQPQATVYDLPAHTTVTPLAEMAQYASLHLQPAALQPQKPDITMKDVMEQLTERIGRKFADTGRDIACTIFRNKPQVNIHIHDGYKNQHLK